jgi:hypothetical protein
MKLPEQRFSRILESLDGDIELFAGIAGQVARHYASYAEQMQILLDEADYKGLERMAHKLKATWALDFILAKQHSTSGRLHQGKSR